MPGITGITGGYSMAIHPEQCIELTDGAGKGELFQIRPIDQELTGLHQKIKSTIVEVLSARHEITTAGFLRSSQMNKESKTIQTP